MTEAVDAEGVALVAEYADIIQIGARNMQNYSLLRAAGRAGKPVLLKRGMSATIKELLLAAEYIVVEGESRVMLCERGVRNFDTHARNLLDLTALVSIKELSHLPTVADPSHGQGSDIVIAQGRPAQLRVQIEIWLRIVVIEQPGIGRRLQQHRGSGRPQPWFDRTLLRVRIVGV